MERKLLPLSWCVFDPSRCCVFAAAAVVIYSINPTAVPATTGGVIQLNSNAFAMPFVSIACVFGGATTVNATLDPVLGVTCQARSQLILQSWHIISLDRGPDSKPPTPTRTRPQLSDPDLNPKPSPDPDPDLIPELDSVLSCCLLAGHYQCRRRY